MNMKNQKHLVAEAIESEIKAKTSISKKLMSAFMSICTALSRPNNRGLEEWEHIELRKPYTRPPTELHNPLYGRFM